MFEITGRHESFDLVVASHAANIDMRSLNVPCSLGSTLDPLIWYDEDSDHELMVDAGELWNAKTQNLGLGQ